MTKHPNPVHRAFQPTGSLRMAPEPAQTPRSLRRCTHFGDKLHGLGWLSGLSFVRGDTFSTWTSVPKQGVGVAPYATEPPPSLRDQFSLGAKHAHADVRMKSIQYSPSEQTTERSGSGASSRDSIRATASAAQDQLHHPRYGQCGTQLQQRGRSRVPAQPPAAASIFSRLHTASPRRRSRSREKLTRHQAESGERQRES